MIRHSIAATKVEAINNWNEPKERITNFARLVGTLIWNDPLNVSMVVFFNMVIKKAFGNYRYPFHCLLFPRFHYTGNLSKLVHFYNN